MISAATLTRSNLEEYVSLVEESVHPILPQVLAHYRDELPNECVGLIWASGLVQRLLNQARSKSRFSISTSQLAEKLTEVDDTNILICVYHSHPDNSLDLSWDDKRSMLRQWDNGLRVPWLIVTETQSCLWYPLDLELHTSWGSKVISHD